MTRRSMDHLAAVVASLSLVFAVVVPFHIHACQWPVAPSGAATVAPSSNDTGAATGHERPCLACTLDRHLQAPVTPGAVARLALPAGASVALAPPPDRPVADERRLTPPRGPPLSS